MEFIGIELAKVILKFSLTDTEADDISLALSMCEMSPTTEREVQAAKTLSAFAEMLNELMRQKEECAHGDT